MKHKMFAAVAVLATLFALSGCGGDEPAETSSATRTAANGDEFNDADVAFATEMIPHHAQALEMAEMAVGRDLDPQVARLATDIRDAQEPEIEQMSDWLTAWGEPVPETTAGQEGMDMGSESDMDMGMDMPGMMSEEEMTALNETQGAEFEALWMEMMIEHHEGAIEMAETEQSDGVYQPAIELADSIATSQQGEIDTMEDLLAS